MDGRGVLLVAVAPIASPRQDLIEPHRLKSVLLALHPRDAFLQMSVHFVCGAVAYSAVAG